MDILRTFFLDADPVALLEKDGTRFKRKPDLLSTGIKKYSVLA